MWPLVKKPEVDMYWVPVIQEEKSWDKVFTKYSPVYQIATMDYQNRVGYSWFSFKDKCIAEQVAEDMKSIIVTAGEKISKSEKFPTEEHYRQFSNWWNATGRQTHTTGILSMKRR